MAQAKSDKLIFNSQMRTRFIILDRMALNFQLKGRLTFEFKYCNPGFPVGCYVTKAGLRKEACVMAEEYRCA